MWYFVRRWEEIETPGDGRSWPFATRWSATQTKVTSDPAMTPVYAQTRAAAEFNYMQQSKAPYWTLRRGAEVWVWAGNQWVRWGSYFGSRYRTPTRVEQWTDMWPLGQRYVRVMPTGPGRWRAIPGAWGITAGQVWTSEYGVAA